MESAIEIHGIEYGGIAFAIAEKQPESGEITWSQEIIFRAGVGLGKYTKRLAREPKPHTECPILQLEIAGWL